VLPLALQLAGALIRGVKFVSANKDFGESDRLRDCFALKRRYRR
jgi:hypothetical protein